MMKRTLLRSAKASFFALLLAANASAGDTRHMRATEAAAIATAVEAFKKIYAKPDLRHYSIDYIRKGNELEITFLTDSDGTNTIGGGNSFGPDMTYVVSLKTSRILRYNFWR